MGLTRYFRIVRDQPPGLRRAALTKGLRCYFPSLFMNRTLRRLTRAPRADLARFLDEIDRSSPVVRHVETCLAEYKAEIHGHYSPGGMSIHDGRMLYAIVRALGPDQVIETGTASGVSTTFLLAALDRNQSGNLISIDLPFEEQAGGVRPFVAGSSADRDLSLVPPGREPGWIVPPELRTRWDLRLGDAKELLPGALEECPGIGLFLHDSLHTREHMLFEFEEAWPHLRTGGVLVSDDAFMGHDALTTFADRVREPILTFCRAAFIRKGS